MPVVDVNGVRLYYELSGEGEPLVLVHGSWGDATGWALAAPALAESFRVLRYDRRGHSRSERPDSQGSVDEDGDDLAALIEELELAPVHVVTSSYGGNIALRLAARRPDLFRSLSCHEPPLFGLLGEDERLRDATSSVESVARRIAEGDHEGAARQFAEEVALGPGAWDQLPPEAKDIMVGNAPTFLDELQDPNSVHVDEDAMARIDLPVRLSCGTDSPWTFPAVIDRLTGLIPGATSETIDGVGHAPHMTAPERYAELTSRAVRAAA